MTFPALEPRDVLQEGEEKAVLKRQLSLSEISLHLPAKVGLCVHVFACAYMFMDVHMEANVHMCLHVFKCTYGGNVLVRCLAVTLRLCRHPPASLPQGQDCSQASVHLAFHVVLVIGIHPQA